MAKNALKQWKSLNQEWILPHQELIGDIQESEKVSDDFGNRMMKFNFLFELFPSIDPNYNLQFGIKYCIESFLREKTTEIKLSVKNCVQQFLKLDLDKLPLRKIRELLCNFNSVALKIKNELEETIQQLQKKH